MIDWYLKVIKENYANFEGRARRSEYWYYTLMNIIIAIVLFTLSVAAYQLIFLYWLYALAVFIPGLAVTVRRLHDTNKSGWFFLVVFIPLIGGIWLIVLLATEGDSGSNNYGQDPKNPYDEFGDIGKTEI
jgi:uncharacterized membrane protein YhaH (DUF805 family)